jgi:hypothetical protein
MLVCVEIDRKLVFTIKSNKTVRKIDTWNGGTVLRVKEEEDGLHSNPHGTVFTTHHLQAFIEVAIHSFDHHGVVIAAR